MFSVFNNSPDATQKIDFLKELSEKLDELSGFCNTSLYKAVLKSLSENTKLALSPSSLQERVEEVRHLLEERGGGEANIAVECRIHALLDKDPNKELQILRAAEKIFFNQVASSTVLATALLLPENQKDLHSVRKVTALFHDVTNRFEQDSILRSVRLIPVELRSDAIGRLILLDTPSEIRGELLRLIAGLPPAERISSKILEASSLFQSMKNKCIRAEFLIFINNIPESLRSAAIEETGFLFAGLNNSILRQEVLKTIDLIPTEHLTISLMHAVVSLFQVTSEDFGMYKTILLLPPEERASFLEDSIPYLQGITTGSGRLYLLGVIYSIAPDKRAEILRTATPGIRDVQDKETRGAFLKVLSLIPEPQRFSPAVSTAVLTVVKQIEKNSDRLPFIETVRNYPDSKKVGLFLDAVSFSKDSLFEFSAWETFEVLSTFSEEEESFQKCCVIAGLLRKHESRSERASFLNAVLLLPKKTSESDEVLQALSIFFQGISEGTELLNYIRSLPENARAELPKRAAPFLPETPTESERIFILAVLDASGQKSPSEEDAVLIERAVPYFQALHQKFGFSSIIDIVLSLSDPSIETLINQVELIFWDFIQSTRVLPLSPPFVQSMWIDILKIGGLIPSAQRTDSVLRAVCILRDHELTTETLFNDIKRIPESIRAVAIEKSSTENYADMMLSWFFDIIDVLPESLKTDSKLREITAEKDVIELNAGLDMIRMIPKDSVNGTSFSEISTLIGGLGNYSYKDSIMEALLLLPPDKRLDAIHFLNHNFTEIEEFLLQRNKKHFDFIFLHPAFVSAAQGYLLNELEEEISDPSRARHLSETILSRPDSLGIHEEHPLFQAAIRAYCITDTSLANDPKNPYILYKDLLEKNRTEELWKKNPPVYFIENFLVGVIPKGFRSMLQRQFTGEDLPEGGCEISFKELFEPLERRYGEVAEEIVMSYEVSLDLLKTNLLDGPVVRNLLRMPQNPKDPIREESFYLYQILQSIVKASSTPISGELLSPRERALLSFAHSMRACKTGQLDTVALYYNNLPEEFRTKGSLGQMSSQKVLSDFMSNFLQIFLHEIFASRDLLLSITGESEVSQASHQTLYLKNRLHKHVGLRHSITFDPHSYCLLDELLTTPLDSLLHSFFQCCTPNGLVNDLMSEVNRLLKDPKAKIMMPLNDFFESSGGIGDRMTYREELNLVELTQSGALNLLEYFNYLKIIRDKNANFKTITY